MINVYFKNRGLLACLKEQMPITLVFKSGTVIYNTSLKLNISSN